MTQREYHIPGFEQKDNLIRGRLWTYILSLMLARLSSLLLTNIDGIMIGNYVGSDALSAVNIFYPTELIIGSVVTMLCAGVSNYIPVIIGRNEPDRLNAAYCAISIIKKIFAAVITLLQIPLIYLMIRSYGLQADMEFMVWSYALGIIVSRPFYLDSMVSFDQLTSIGKVKVYTVISMTGAALDLVLDYLFIAVLGFGITGAGMTTGLCVILQYIMLRLYISSKTDLRNFRKAPCKEEVKAILAAGVPAALMQLLQGLQIWCMTWCISRSIGMIGTSTMSVLSFANNVILAFLSSVVSAGSPLVGMFHGAGNYKVTDRLMRVIIRTMCLIGLGLTAVFCLTSGYIFRLFGFSNTLDIQKDMLYIFLLYLFVQWVANAIALYFGATLQNRLNAFLRAFPLLVRIGTAFILYRLAGGVSVMWAYVIPSVLYVLMSSGLYAMQRISRNRKMASGDTEYMFISLKKDKGALLPEKIENDLVERNVEKGIANRIAVATDELIAIVRQRSRVATDIDICIILGENNTLMIWDDGPPTELTGDVSSSPEEIFSGFLVRSLAKYLQCSRVYDLNYVTVKL